MEWSPPEWACNCFPLPDDGGPILGLDWLIATLHAHVDTVTDDDTTALGQALHVAHILVTMQGQDGRWPERFNAETGEEIGPARSFAPAPLFVRLNTLLDSSEFDSSCRLARAGGWQPPGE